ncbi:MAG: hypothetical protein O2960_30040 [Verrucomicrobia bacterium]|nr:hypothetical protein [Verrucomicrobiota bacterium]
MNPSLISYSLIAIAFSAVSQTFAGNWPAWRGPDGNGGSSDKNLLRSEFSSKPFLKR